MCMVFYLWGDGCAHSCMRLVKMRCCVLHIDGCTFKCFDVFCGFEVANVDTALALGGLEDAVDVFWEDLMRRSGEVGWVLIVPHLKCSKINEYKMS